MLSSALCEVRLFLMRTQPKPTGIREVGAWPLPRCVPHVQVCVPRALPEGGLSRYLVLSPVLGESCLQHPLLPCL